MEVENPLSYFNVKNDEEISFNSDDERVLLKDEGKFQKQIINREEDLERKYLEMKARFEENFLKRARVEQRKKGVGWLETLELVSPGSVQLVSAQVNDDIQRELQFYNIALENAKKGLKLLKKADVKIVRPNDYMAEMYKSDEVMLRIKNNLVHQQIKIQNLEEKKNRIANKKFQKKLVQYKKIQQVREKKNNLQAIDRWKEEIKQKGDKASDLESFMKKSRKGARTDAKRGPGIRKKIQKQKRPGKLRRQDIKKKKYSSKNH